MDSLVFWLVVFTILYVYLGFPMMVALFGQVRNRSVKKAPVTPSVSLIIAAHNEAENIAAKLENFLALDYPEGLLEIVVASDGSTDATEAVVSKYAARGVKLLALPRQGKIEAMHAAIRQSGGEILLFSDATTLFEPQAIKKLVRNFADPEVGGVSGNQKNVEAGGVDHSSKGEGLYWRYDKWIKSLETRTGSIVSAGGAIYGIRRALYEKPASNSVADDFAISTIVIEKGFRLVFESEAIAYETPASSAQTEFSRKVRIINGGLRGVLLRRALLNPFQYGFYSLILFSHKVLRRMVPFLLIILFAVSLMLALNNQFYYFVTLVQGLFYLFAILGYFLRNSSLGGSKLFYIPFFYCLANGASLVAILRIMAGEKIHCWEPAR